MIIESILLGLFGIVLALAGGLISIVAAVVLLFFRRGIQSKRNKEEQP